MPSGAAAQGKPTFGFKPCYIALDKPEAAERIAMRIVAILEALRNHPRPGRAGPKPSLRELVIGGTPFIVLYQFQHKRIIMTTTWHAVMRNHL